ncbi:cytosine permease [Escherichia coli]
MPFATILRASDGVRGALFPGLLGGIAAIMWFWVCNVARVLLAVYSIGNLAGIFNSGYFTLLGLSLPGLISYSLPGGLNVGIGFGGGKVLNKFTAILNPCILYRFGGMAIWAISLVGIGRIFDYIPAAFRKQKTVASCSWW